MKKCLMCQKKVHRECELHTNDGAVDLEDYIQVRCDCPCQGRVSTNSTLLGLVAKLDNTINSMKQEVAVARDRSEKNSPYRQMLSDFFHEVLDDEGGLLDVGQYRNWAIELRHLHTRFLKMTGVDIEDDEDTEPEDEDYWEAD